MKQKLIYTIVLIICWGCNHYTPKEYVQYITNVTNGMHSKVIRHTIHYNIQYLPKEYKSLLKGSESDINSAYDFHEGINFNLKIVDSSYSRTNNIEQQNVMNSKDNYNLIHFWFEPMVYLVLNKDTLGCRLSHLEPVGINNPVYNFSLIFDQSESYLNNHRKDSIYFVFEDVVWSKEKIVSSFLVNDLLDTPTLKL